MSASARAYAGPTRPTGLWREMFPVILSIAAGCSSRPEGGREGTDPDPDPDPETEVDADTAPDADTAARCTPAVEIGAGDVAWVALAADAEAVMVHGPQGGWHILWSARVAGFEPTLQLRGILRDQASSTVVSDMTYHVAQAPLDGCVGESIGHYGYLDVAGLAVGSLDTPPELLVGHALLLRVEASDFIGTSAASEVVVIAAPDPTDVD